MKLIKKIVISTTTVVFSLVLLIGFVSEANSTNCDVTDGVARYGEHLSAELPVSFATKGSTANQTIDSSWKWIDNCYFGAIGSKKIVVSNASQTAYDTVTVSVQPRTITPILKQGNSEITIPGGWNSNPPTDISTYQHTVTVTASTGGTVSGSGTYTQGQQYTISASADSGHIFKQWSDGNTDASRTFIMGSSNVEYAANFGSYGSTTISGNGGMVLCGGMQNSGTFTGKSINSINGKTRLVAVPDSNYSFNKWNDGYTDIVRIIICPSETDQEFYPIWKSGSNSIKVTSTLPANVGDISIMSLSQLFNALSGSSSTARYDPTRGGGTSTYYVYGICNNPGSTGSTTGSTSASVQAVGLNWYKHFRLPNTNSKTWTQSSYKLFGGPLYEVRKISNSFTFNWYYGSDYEPITNCGSSSTDYWNNAVDASVYVAVIRARK